MLFSNKFPFFGFRMPKIFFKLLILIQYRLCSYKNGDQGNTVKPRVPQTWSATSAKAEELEINDINQIIFLIRRGQVNLMFQGPDRPRPSNLRNEKEKTQEPNFFSFFPYSAVKFP